MRRRTIVPKSRDNGKFSKRLFVLKYGQFARRRWWVDTLLQSTPFIVGHVFFFRIGVEATVSRHTVVTKTKKSTGTGNPNGSLQGLIRAMFVRESAHDEPFSHFTVSPGFWYNRVTSHSTRDARRRTAVPESSGGTNRPPKKNKRAVCRGHVIGQFVQINLGINDALRGNVGDNRVVCARELLVHQCEGPLQPALRQELPYARERELADLCGPDRRGGLW